MMVLKLTLILTRLLIFIYLFFSDLKDFLNNQKDYWVAKQKEVEERFMEVDEEGQDPDLMAPKPEKEKEKQRGSHQAKKIPMPDLQQSFKLFFY